MIKILLKCPEVRAFGAAGEAYFIIFAYLDKFCFMKGSSRKFLCFAVVAGALPSFPGTLYANGGNTRPNIVFILADDLGYMDICAFARHVTGTPVDSMFYETPNLDRMVAQGVAFTNAYVCPLSSPTRASLMTGKYAFTLGFTTAMPLRDTWYNRGGDTPVEGYVHDVTDHRDDIRIPQAVLNAASNSALPAGLPQDRGLREITLAEAMEGYHTVFIGKWHIGGFGAQGYQPADRGFDAVPAYCDAGASMYFNWRRVWNEKTLPARWPCIPQREWCFGDAGMESDEEYLTDDLTEKAVAYIRSRSGQSDTPFFLYMSHFAVHTPIQAKMQDTAYFSRKVTKGWNNHSNAVYAAMIRSLDDSVGRILETLKETGLDQNTVVVFLSDNGGIDRKIAVAEHDITDNSPYLGGKATLFEGGVKSPLIIWAPGMAPGGIWSEALVDASDLFPTLLDLAGVELRPFYEDVRIDGRSFRSLFDCRNDAPRQAFSRNEIYWHYPFNVIYDNPVDGWPLTPHSGIRIGNLKLIFDWHGRLYLFDLADDPFERHNVAAKRPNDTRRLFARLAEMLAEHVPIRYWPRPNPAYDPACEVRTEAPYVDLIDCYQRGGDVVAAATIPDMGRTQAASAR